MYDEEIRRYQQQVSKLKDRNTDTASGRRKYMSQAVPRNSIPSINNKIDSEQG